MKLHNNMLAHQTTPADYILSIVKIKHIHIYEIKQLFLYLVECKQVTCENGKGRLAFKRLKQMHDLLAFEKICIFHKSFFCIAYYNERWSKSDVYLVPTYIMKNLIDTHPYISLNVEDARINLGAYKIEMQNGLFSLNTLYSKEYL